MPGHPRPGCAILAEGSRLMRPLSPARERARVRGPMGRQPKQYSQADRVARMMRALSSRACTVNDLAQEFGITKRQVYRDLKRIEEEGHPLTQSDGLGERTWQLPLGYKGLPPITLTPYELMSLYLAKSNLSFLAGTPFTDDLDGVIRKLTDAF